MSASISELKAPFPGMPVHAVGHTIQMVGAIYSSGERTYYLLFPEDGGDHELPRSFLTLTLEEWKRLIRQTDLMETEVLAKASDGALAKVLVRKSTRLIEQGVSWAVWRRDGYACRYCGRNDVPLTVDHLICWEALGPSIESNLVTACRKCNKVRGDTTYADWLTHPYYLVVSRELPSEQRAANAQVLATLSKIPLRIHERSR